MPMCEYSPLSGNIDSSFGSFSRVILILSDHCNEPRSNNCKPESQLAGVHW